MKSGTDLIEPAVALLRWISALGGGVDVILADMALDLARRIETEKKLPKSYHKLIGQIIAGVEGLLGEPLAGILRRELGEAMNGDYPNVETIARRRLALRYLETTGNDGQGKPATA